MKIKPDKKNANRGTERGRELLKHSLREFGAGRSILVDKAGNVIAGNKTLEQAQAMGMPIREVETYGNELIVVRRNDLDLTEDTGKARQLAYADNRVAEIDLAWEAEQLAADLAAGIDLGALGFTPEELNDILEALGKKDEVKAKSDMAEQLQKEWGTESGQVWKLGEHRIICGDCTKSEDAQKLMDGEQATLCFTSPPYWVGKSYETQKSVAEIEEFIFEVASVIASVVRKDCSRIVINTGTGFTTSFDKKNKRQVLLLIDKWTNVFYELGWNLRHVRHWIKEGQLMSVSPRTDLIDQHCEFLGTFENMGGGAMEFNDVIQGEDINLIETFYNREGEQRGQFKTGKEWALRSYWDDIRGNANSNEHEAAMPSELVLRHLMLYTKQDEIVFEPFSGSGTTVISCETLKRKCRAMEISPAYVAVTLQRYMDATGIRGELLQ
jgi:DNA modification methylase